MHGHTRGGVKSGELGPENGELGLMGVQDMAGREELGVVGVQLPTAVGELQQGGLMLLRLCGLAVPEELLLVPFGDRRRRRRGESVAGLDEWPGRGRQGSRKAARSARGCARERC